MWTQQVAIKRFKPSGVRSEKDTLILTKELAINLNNKLLVRFHTVPYQMIECALGYLFAHNFITSREDVQSISLDGNSIDCTINSSLSSIEPLSEKAPISDESVLHLTAYFQEKALLFKQTAISESAALASDESIEFFAEDIDSDQSVYRCIGQWLQSKTDQPPKHLIVSSKITQELIDLVSKLGVSSIISRTAPTFYALENAKKHGIHVIGFARGTRFNRYS